MWGTRYEASPCQHLFYADILQCKHNKLIGILEAEYASVCGYKKVYIRWRGAHKMNLVSLNLLSIFRSKKFDDILAVDVSIFRNEREPAILDPSETNVSLLL
jgi:hypothetical protein